MAGKRRQENFSAEEKDCLIDIVRRYKDTIECKNFVEGENGSLGRSCFGILIHPLEKKKPGHSSIRQITNK